jgi:hypothetical protein
MGLTPLRGLLEHLHTLDLSLQLELRQLQGVVHFDGTCDGCRH